MNAGRAALRTSLAWVLTGGAVLACSTDGASNGTGGPDGGSGSGGEGRGGSSPLPVVDFPPGAERPLVGTFDVEMVGPSSSVPDGYVSLVGKVYDGPSPETIVWEESLAEGDCTLYEPRVPFCEQPCGGSAACVEDDTCVPYPTARDAGTVTMTGLTTRAGATEFSMEPIANGYQPTGGVQLGLDAFAEGGPIGLSATGGAFAPFSIAATGVALLELDPAEIGMTPDVPIGLRWTAAGIADISTIDVKIDISHHGGSKGKILCETADDGSLEIASALVTRLLDLGVSGFPTIVTQRRSVGSTDVEVGRVELVVSSSVEREVAIDGLTSCTANDQCPSGQTCQVDLRCE